MESTPALPRSQVIAGLALAVFSALVGFLLTWGGVQGRGKRLDLPAVDRRAAESGRVARPGSTVPQLGEAPAPAQAPALAVAPAPAEAPGLDVPTVPATGVIPEVPTAASPAPSPAAEAGAAAPRPGPTAPSVYLQPAPRPPGGGYPGGSRKGRTQPRRDGAPAPGQPDGYAAAPVPPGASARRYPDPGPARPERPLDEIWAAVSPACLLLESDQFPVGSATAVGNGLMVTTLGALRQRGPLSFAGNYGVGDPVATDPQHGLALLMGAGNLGLALAPAAPVAGQELAAGPGFQSGDFQRCVVSERLPGGLFLFRGLTLPGSTGAPMVNTRGEVVGIVLGKASGYPGNDYGIAADTSLVLALLETRDEGPPRGPSADVVSQQVQRLMLRDVPAVDHERSARSNARVIPGTSLGNYRIGVERDALVKALGAGQSRWVGEDVESLAYRVYRLEFTLMAGRVVAISTTDPFYGTSTGIGVGTNWAEARPGPEFGEAVIGFAPGGRFVVVGAGLELDVGPRGEVQRLTVTPR